MAATLERNPVNRSENFRRHSAMKASPLDTHAVFSSERQELKRPPWLDQTVIYQIYPTTYRDGNGDGVGDLQGVVQKLDYLQDLGVGALWFSPLYPSPMRDGGYDIANYKAIHPQFGTIEDFDTLVRLADTRGMRVIMDMVMNHTSDQHAWFTESRSSRDNPKRNWYIWRDPKPDGSPPNNWESFFGGSAWTFDRATGQYYLHKFDPSQPDVNMWNEEVQEAMKDGMRFWLDRGVAGFRMDVLDHLFEDPSFTDASENPDFIPGQIPIDRWRWREKYILKEPVYDWVREVAGVLRPYNAVGIGEIGSSDLGHIRNLYDAGLHVPMNFRLLNGIPFEAGALKKEIDEYMAALPPDALPNLVFGNHDNPRLVSRIGSEKAKAALLLLMSQRGVPFLYNGEEIGMEDGVISQTQNRDPQGNRLGIAYSRDPARTPMQWDESLGAGFSDSASDLYLPIGNNKDGRNVAAQKDDPKSILNRTRSLIDLRKKTPALRDGDYVPYSVEGDNVFVFGRESPGQLVLVAISTADHALSMRMPEGIAGGNVLASTNGKQKGAFIPEAVELGPFEGVILETVPKSTTVFAA